MKMWLIAAIAGAGLWGNCATPTSSIAGNRGSGTETTTGVVARVIRADGTPLARAAVRVRLSGYVSGGSLTKDSLTAADVLTDTSGRFSIRGLDSGNYCIEVNDGRGAAVVVRELLSTQDSIRDLGTLTARPYGQLHGVVPAATDPAGELLIQVRGLERLVAVVQDTFSIVDLPAGSHQVRCVRRADPAVAVVNDRQVTTPSGAKTGLCMLDGWHYGASYRLNTAQPGASITETLTGFPLLLRLDSDGFDFSQASPDGRDLRVHGWHGRALPFEIEEFDAVAHKAVLWVRVDTLWKERSDQGLYLSWGNPQASPLSAGSSVFDTSSGFQAVWHLSGSPLECPDATGNRFDGVVGGSRAPDRVSAIVGSGKRFDGQETFYRVPGSATGKLDLAQGADFTVSAWVKTATIDSASYLIVGKGYFQYFLDLRYTKGHAYWELSDYVTTPIMRWVAASSTDGATADTWTLVTGSRRGSELYLYLDGMLDVTLNNIRVGIDTVGRQSDAEVTIGRFLQSVNPDSAIWDSGTCGFLGDIDEIRICNRARSAAWIRACFLNQRPEGGLVERE